MSTRQMAFVLPCTGIMLRCSSKSGLRGHQHCRGVLRDGSKEGLRRGSTRGVCRGGLQRSLAKEAAKGVCKVGLQRLSCTVGSAKTTAPYVALITDTWQHFLFVLLAVRFFFCFFSVSAKCLQPFSTTGAVAAANSHRQGRSQQGAQSCLDSWAACGHTSHFMLVRLGSVEKPVIAHMFVTLSYLQQISLALLPYLADDKLN